MAEKFTFFFFFFLSSQMWLTANDDLSCTIQTDFKSAADRSCDNQKNACAELSNSKKIDAPVSECDRQNTECKAAAASATQTAFNALVSSNAEFDFFCDL